MKPTIYDTITQQIVAAIEAGAGPYRMPWHSGSGGITIPRNAASGRCYRGVNTLALWMTAEARQFSSGTWATYQQWQDKGAQVRKGEKSGSVVFWKTLGEGPEGQDDAAPDSKQGRFVARAYHVFNADQVEGYEAPNTPLLPESERVAAAEAFVEAIPATITHRSSVPCFMPGDDTIAMVPFEHFVSGASYYAVLAHELTHWSGAKSRLNRDLSGRFGSDAYAMEELVAELGAAFIAGQLGLPSEPRTDHAPYIANWLKVLKGDSRAIFTAAGKAQTAADYLAAFSKPAESP